MMHEHLTDEDASLYVLGSMGAREAAGFDREALRCDECARHLADASQALERIALSDLVASQTPGRLLTGRPRRRAGVNLSAFGAIAAAIVITIFSAWRVATLESTMHYNDLVLSAIVHSHFGHAQFVPSSAGARPQRHSTHSTDRGCTLSSKLRPNRCLWKPAAAPHFGF
jgi:hypothetical protein